MAKFSSFKIVMEAEGDFPVKLTLEATNPDEQFVLLQQLALVNSQKDLLEKQLAGQV